MKVDMSHEAITNCLKIMEQLWGLSINLMQAKGILEKEPSPENKPDSKDVELKYGTNIG